MTRLVNRLALGAYALAVAVIALDQWLKHWIVDVYRLPERETTPGIGPMHLSMVWNRGFSFGLLNGGDQWSRWGLTVFSFVAAVVVAVWVRQVQRPLLAIAAGLVIGGALGNRIDRLRYGAVVDFIDFTQWRFPWVFNVADAAINIGVVLLVCDTLLTSRKAAAR